MELPVDGLRMESLMTNELMERGYLTKSLGNAAHSGDHGLKNVAGLLRRALDKHVWKERIIVETGEKFEGFPNFEIYTEANPPKGLGIDVETLKRLVEHDPKLIDDIDKLTQRSKGNPTGANQYQSGNGVNHSISSSEEKRNRSTQQLRRLRKDYPDLHAQVLRNEKTINEAAVEAGIYPARIAVNLNDAKSAASTLLTWGSPEFLAELRRLLNS